MAVTKCAFAGLGQYLSDFNGIGLAFSRLTAIEGNLSSRIRRSDAWIAAVSALRDPVK
jgi:hypothetical protein